MSQEIVNNADLSSKFKPITLFETPNNIISLDITKLTLTSSENPRLNQNLTPREWMLFVTLLINSNVVVTLNELNSVLGLDTQNQDNKLIRINVHRLRGKLNIVEPALSDTLVTVRPSIGYAWDENRNFRDSQQFYTQPPRHFPKR